MNTFRKHIIIVGTARSGTSWLSETIARQYRYRILFEPEQETRTKRGFLICDQWINNKNDSKEAYKYLKQVFSNKVDCDWIAQNSNRTLKRHLWPFIAKKYVIKFVRANLAAKFMNQTFGIPVIHLIRNPYDVIASQQQVKFPWLVDLSHFVAQTKLVQTLKDKFNYNLLEYKTLTTVQILALRWCIENVLILETEARITHTYEVVRYEDLFKNIQTFYDLCNKFDLEPISNLDHYYKQPSSKTHPESKLLSNSNKKSYLTDNDIDQINDILDKFNTDLYPRK
ncbi:sulfotransferase domain-containing protein [uncultured Psychroserpens sp.]|uniref:sulfotransferase domain-containing protein n=1 Tax=uncultured Psychroserpens sp. TaxID=255436 RepID=UPI00261FB850|nr:sulfotransferase domain-containing protein [uncultured Psychroserpens sp.]